jgi:5-deoxy-glucuronate isomerase
MSLLVKAREGRDIVKVTPASAGWKYVGFEGYRLKAGEALEVELPADREGCLVVLTGKADVTVGADAWTNLGGRASVFDERSPDAVYAPPGSRYRIDAHDDVELALATAPATGKHAARLIPSAQMKRSVRGQGTNTRYVCDILPQTEPAESLLQLSAAQARQRQRTGGKLAGRNLLPPHRSAARLCIPARVHRCARSG